MSVNENPAAGGPMTPGEPFPRAADIFDREAFALRLADARRRRAGVLAQRAAAARQPRSAVSSRPPLKPAALPPAPRPSAGLPASPRRSVRRLSALAVGLALLGAVVLLPRPGGPLSLGLSLFLPQTGPSPVGLDPPEADGAGGPLLPRDLAPVRATTSPGALARPPAEVARAFEASPWVPRPMARPEGLRRIVPVRKRPSGVAAQPPVAQGVERFLRRIGIRQIAPRPAGQRDLRD